MKKPFDTPKANGHSNPMTNFHIRDGTMQCEAVPLPTIAREVGTPVYVYSAAIMRRQAADFRAALRSLPDPLIAFAVKANPNAAVLATLAREGLGADVVSGGEYARAIAAGMRPCDIVFSGVGKTADEMERALAGGLAQFNLESVAEADMMSAVATRMGRTAPIAFRINPDVAAGTHAKISTGAAHNKFGVAIGDSPAAYAHAASLPGLSIQGVAVHIGSQLALLAPLEAAFAKLGALVGTLRAAGHGISTVDLGGGLGISYDSTQTQPPGPQAYGEMVAAVASGWNARLIFEPGRFMVAEAGILLAKVIRLKPGADNGFVIVDAAMNDLMRPSLYDAWHSIEAVRPTGKTMVADIVGPVCETGDTFARAREMEAVAADDLLVFRTAGAYGAAMSSTYNSRALTPEVLVDGDRWEVVRPRISIEQLIAGERVPSWLTT